MLGGRVKAAQAILVGAMVSAGVLVAGAGCAATEGEPTSHASGPVVASAATPSEWVVLVRACLEEGGLHTTDDPGGDPTAYAVSFEGVPEDEFERIRTTCTEQLGERPMANLSDEELRARYDARVEQWACLVSAGGTSGPPITYETFVDGYQRSGQTTVWEPVESVPAGDFDATAVCPMDSW